MLPSIDQMLMSNFASGDVAGGNKSSKNQILRDVKRGGSRTILSAPAAPRGNASRRIGSSLTPTLSRRIAERPPWNFTCGYTAKPASRPRLHDSTPQLDWQPQKAAKAVCMGRGTFAYAEFESPQRTSDTFKSTIFPLAGNIGMYRSSLEISPILPATSTAQDIRWNSPQLQRRTHTSHYSFHGKGQPPVSCDNDDVEMFGNPEGAVHSSPVRKNVSSPRHQACTRDRLFGGPESAQRRSKLSDTVKSSVFSSESENDSAPNTPQKKKIPQIWRNPITGEVSKGARTQESEVNGYTNGHGHGLVNGHMNGHSNGHAVLNGDVMTATTVNGQLTNGHC